MFSGGCNCGAVRYSVSADPLAVAVCHCTRCRNQSGSAFSVNLVVAETAIEVTGMLTTFTDGESSSGQPVLRQFCGICGSPIRSMPAANPGIAVIKAGTTDNPDPFVPTVHVWTQSKLAWVEIPDSLPVFAQKSGHIAVTDTKLRDTNELDLPVDRQRLTSPDGVRLTADIVGPRDAPAVVLLHGGGQTRHSWSNAAQQLARQGYRVVNFDARGHGDSDWSKSGAYTLDDRVADLGAIIDGSLDAPYVLIGASLGGATALHAIASGLRPAGLVLVDIVPFPEKTGIDRIVGFMRGHGDGFASLDDAVAAVAAYNPDRPPSKDASGLARNLRLRADGRLYWHWDPLIVAGRTDDIHNVVQQSAQRVADIPGLPVLLVRGLNSDVVSDRGIATYRAMMPRLEVADIAGAGHMVAGDRNDAFVEGLSGFLSRVLPICGPFAASVAGAKPDL